MSPWHWHVCPDYVGNMILIHKHTQNPRFMHIHLYTCTCIYTMYLCLCVCGHTCTCTCTVSYCIRHWSLASHSGRGKIKPCKWMIFLAPHLLMVKHLHQPHKSVRRNPVCTTERLIDKNSCHFIHKMSFVTFNICTCTICMYVCTCTCACAGHGERDGDREVGEGEGGRVGERGGEGVDREAIFLWAST